MTTSGHGRGTLALIGAFVVLAALIIPTRPSAGSPPPRTSAPRPAAHASWTAPTSPVLPGTSTRPLGRLPARDRTAPPRKPGLATLPGGPGTTTGAGPQALPARSGCPAPPLAPVHRAPGSGRTVALTFDDGPSRYTPELLAVLRREHVHATFFVVGANAANDPATVARTVREGHLVGDHTWHHSYPGTVRGGWTRSYLRGEMLSTRRAVASSSGARVCWFRPPGGVTNPVLVQASRELGFSVALWSVDTRDWQLQGEGHRFGAGVTHEIVTRATAGLAQQHPVILMHDGGGDRSAGVAAVARIIDTYRAHGYRFVRLDGRS